MDISLIRIYRMKHLFLFAILNAINVYISSVSATTLGHVTVADPILGSRSVVYEIINDYAVVEGDILIGKVAALSVRSACILPKIGGGLWPNGIVAFELNEDLPLMNKLAILQAITLLQQKTNVNFVELTSKNRYLHPDYISFVPADGTTCASFVGKQRGPQIIELSRRCNTMNTVHEIGHALGLWHEQSRADRDFYVQIIWENIQNDHRYNFEQHLNDGVDFGEYDYQSIMHYPANAFSKNGLDTIIPLKSNVEIGQRKTLTEKDIAAINAMYPVE